MTDFGHARTHELTDAAKKKKNPRYLQCVDRRLGHPHDFTNNVHLPGTTLPHHVICGVYARLAPHKENTLWDPRFRMLERSAYFLLQSSSLVL
jgi:hypothetical protein